MEGPLSRPAPEAPGVGLCAGCAHAVTVRSARGSVFWRCRAAERDARLARYPRLPVVQCVAFDVSSPERRQRGGNDDR